MCDKCVTFMSSLSHFLSLLLCTVCAAQSGEQDQDWRTHASSGQHLCGQDQGESG